jgi:hypothetical protein
MTSKQKGVCFLGISFQLSCIDVIKPNAKVKLSETGRGGPYDYETSRLQYFLDNLPTDGGEVVILT